MANDKMITTPQPYREKKATVSTTRLEALKQQRAAEVAAEAKGQGPEPETLAPATRTADIKSQEKAIQLLAGMQSAGVPWEQITAAAEGDERKGVQAWLKDNQPKPAADPPASAEAQE